MSRGVQKPRLDANHAEVVHTLLDIGCSVQSLASVGLGCPDLIVGRRGVNLLLEIKDGSKPPSACRLTKMEQAFIKRWKGRVFVVHSAEEAIQFVEDYA